MGKHVKTAFLAVTLIVGIATISTGCGSPTPKCVEVVDLDAPLEQAYDQNGQRHELYPVELRFGQFGRPDGLISPFGGGWIELPKGSGGSITMHLRAGTYTLVGPWVSGLSCNPEVTIKRR